MFVLLTDKSKYCSYQFPWLGTLLLDLLGFCLLLLKHLLSGRWKIHFIWEDVEKNIHLWLEVPIMHENTNVIKTTGAETGK